LGSAHLISTFDLTLLGSFVSAGGILFLCRGKRPQFGSRSLTAERSMILSEEGREQHERATMLEAARWLTVGALTLFVGFLHGAEDGYLFGPWSDVMFHVVFVSTCWATAALRINKRTAAVHLPASSAPQVRN
jgi:hypothetical protein